MKSGSLFLIFLFLVFYAYGQLDKSYGDNGMVLKNLGAGNTIIHHSVIDSEGRIITVGYNMWGIRSYYSLMVSRFLPNGKIDSSFAEKGQKILEVGNIENNKCFIKIDNKGRYVIGGSTNGEVFITRIFDDGSLDNSFNNNGELHFKLPDGGAGSIDVLQDIFVHPDNSISVTIISTLNSFQIPPYSYEAQGILKISENGNPDLTFGENGLFIDVLKELSMGFNFSFASQFKFDQNGNTWRVCIKNPETENEIRFIEKRLVNGTVDNSFGVNGRIDITLWSQNLSIIDLFTNNDGSAFLIININQEIRILKIKSNGVSDETWGNGSSFIVVNNQLSNIKGILDLGDNYVVYGSLNQELYPGSSVDATWMTAVFLNKKGQLINAIGENGRLKVDFGTYDQVANHATIAKNGHLLLVGYVGEYGRAAQDRALVLIKKDGLLNTNFGINGKITHMGGENSTYMSDFIAMSDGSLIVTGFASNGNTNNPYITKHKPDGGLDETFADEGISYIPDRNSASGIGLIGEHSNKSFLAIFRLPGSSVTNTIKKILPNGSFDSQWGEQNGAVIIPENEIVYDYQLISNLFLKVVSVKKLNSSTQQLIFRQYNIDGTLDINFGTNGIIKINFSGTGNLKPSEIYYLSNKVMFVGELPDQEGKKVIIINGAQIDNSFGEGGYLSINSPYWSAVPDPLGNIYLLGTKWSEIRTMILKHDSKGQIDLSFGINGEFKSDAYENLNKVLLDNILFDENGNINIIGEFRDFDAFPNFEYKALAKLSSNGIPDLTYGDQGIISKAISPMYIGLCFSFYNKLNSKIMIAGNWGTEERPKYFISQWDSTYKNNNPTFIKENNSFNLSLYPNPTTSDIVLTINEDLNNDAFIRIFDVKGSFIQEQLVGKNQNNKIEINLPSTLSSGWYILTLQNKEKSGSIKFLKH